MSRQQKKILVASFQSLTKRSGGGMARLGFYLSKTLDERGLLQRFVVYSKGKYRTDFKTVPVWFFSRHYLYLLHKINRLLKIPDYRFRFIQEVVYDWFCASLITKNTGILFVTQPYLLHTFRKAKKQGIPIIFIPANPEENYIKKLVTEEKQFLGLEGNDAYTYQPRIDYFNKSISFVDKVIGSYPTVYKTYSQSDFQGEVVELTGHLKPDFMPVSILKKLPSDKTFKVGYLAHTVVLKGVHYLLEAWQQLVLENPDVDMELIVSGKMDENICRYISATFKDIQKVTFSGFIPSVHAFFKKLDLFVVPSLIDGGPYTALEAAHYGVPVLITENCGSAELLSRGKSGCYIVPIRDAKALKNKLLHAYNNRCENIETGMNAKHNLDSYDMQDFIKKLADYLEAL